MTVQVKKKMAHKYWSNKLNIGFLTLQRRVIGKLDSARIIDHLSPVQIPPTSNDGYFLFVQFGVKEAQRPGTDHGTSGPTRGLEKMLMMAHTSRHTGGHSDSMTESAQWGQFSENIF